MDLREIDITTPALFERDGYPWKTWDTLRREAPVFRYERPGIKPFWAITKHRDVSMITRDAQTFNNRPRPLVRAETHDEAKESLRSTEHLAPDLLEMDAPVHGKYRRTVNRFFTPHALRAVEPRIRELAAGATAAVANKLIEAAARTCEFDFVHDFSAKLPIYVICSMLGVPEEDAPKVLVWTNEWIAPADSSFRRGRSLEETLAECTRALYGYFDALIAARRAEPRDDLVSHLLEARVDGRPLTRDELLTMCVLLIVSGNETTRNATSGGMYALLEHHVDLAPLRTDDALLESTVEEILRWSSPIIHMARTATRDVEVAGTLIRRGETVALYYPSANRDEDVFPDPYRFDITRSPNPHVTFGAFGDHHCLGAHLARLELRIGLRTILDRVEGLTLAGPVQYVGSGFVGGFKRMPVRCRLRGD